VLRGPPGYDFRKPFHEQASGWFGVWVGSLAPYEFVGSGWIRLNGPGARAVLSGSARVGLGHGIIDFRALRSPQGSGWHEGTGAYVGYSGWRWADSLVLVLLSAPPGILPSKPRTVATPSETNNGAEPIHLP
jgi:hypothetical protein